MTGLPLIIAFVVAIVLMILLISKLKVHSSYFPAYYLSGLQI